MPSNTQTYAARRAAIETDWADYPGMKAALMAELDAAARGRTVPNGPAPKPRATTIAVEPDSDVEVRNLARTYAATMPYAAALRRAEQVIGAERAADPTSVTEADVELMSIPELEAYLQTFDPRLLNPNNVPIEELPRMASGELAAALAAEREAMAAEDAEQEAWSAGLEDRMAAKATARAVRENAEAARNAAIRSIRASNPEVTSEQAAAMAPSLENLVAALTRPASAADAARASLRAMNPSDAGLGQL